MNKRAMPTRRLDERELAELVDAARAHGLDGQDRGALRKFLWWRWAYSDTVDHALVHELARRLAVEDAAQHGERRGQTARS
ncbi:MAG TPA: hypothetical protein VIN09_02240 [Chloroflexota bacterium]